VALRRFLGLEKEKGVGRKALELAGKKFGKLLVLSKDAGPDTRNSYWRCRCDCGNEVIVAGISLKSGRTVSCGCVNQQKREDFDDKTGQRFGRLTVIKKAEKRKSGRIAWLCECDCGNYCEVETRNLASIISCGCAKTEALQEDCVDNTRLRNLTQKKLRPRKNRDSGCKGVIWDTSREKWLAQIGIQGRHIYLGRFSSLNDAIKARKEAEKKYFAPILEEHRHNKE